MSLAWGAIVSTMLRGALLVTAKRDHLTMLPTLRGAGDVFTFGGWVTGASLCARAAGESNKFILGGFLGPSIVAIFERSAQLPNTARQALLNPVDQVMLPVISKEIREHRPIREPMRNLIGATTSLLWPIFFAMLFVSVPLVVVLFGPEWELAGRILPYLLVSQGILSAIPPLGQVLIPHGQVRALFFVNLFLFAVSFTLAYVGSVSGLERFAMLRIVYSTTSVLIFIQFFLKYVDLSIGNLAGIYARSLRIAVPSSIPSIAYFLVFGAEAHVGWLLLDIVGSFIIWLVMIYWTENFLFVELKLSIEKRFTNFRC